MDFLLLLTLAILLFFALCVLYIRHYRLKNKFHNLSLSNAALLKEYQEALTNHLESLETIGSLLETLWSKEKEKQSKEFTDGLE